MWPTFQSYLLTVHLRKGRVVRAYTEPLAIENYTPRAIGGRLAEPIAREAAGRETGPFVIEDGAVEVDVENTARVTRREVALRAAAGGRVLEVGSGWAVGRDGSGRVEGGRDLLWLGSFEDSDVDDDDTPEAMWTLGGAGAITPEAARAGRHGLELSRNSRDQGSAVAAPRHRLLLEPGRRLTIAGDFRGSTAARARVRVSFYEDTKGRSSAFQVKRLEGSGRWRPFRLDVTVPAETVAVGLYLKLEAPRSGDVAAHLDDLKVIQWAPLPDRPSALPEYVRTRGAARLTLENRRLPGGPAPSTSLLAPVGAR